MWGGKSGIDYQWHRNLVSNKSCDLQCHSGAGVIQLKVNKLTYNGIIDMFIILTDLGRWHGWSLTRHRLYRFYLHIDCVSQCISDHYIIMIIIPTLHILIMENQLDWSLTWRWMVFYEGSLYEAHWFMIQSSLFYCQLVYDEYFKPLSLLLDQF